MKTNQIILFYDEECPFCKNYTNFLKLKKSLNGYKIDGMMFIFQNTIRRLNAKEYNISNQLIFSEVRNALSKPLNETILNKDYVRIMVSKSSILLIKATTATIQQ